MMIDISHERFFCGDASLNPNLASSIWTMDRMQAFDMQIA